MDEIKYKLKTGNSLLVVNAIEKLITTIKTKYKPTEREKFVLENVELKFLREECSSKDTVVSLTACQGLLVLVESGVLEISHTMSTVITLLPSAHNFSAIVSTLAGLLILDLKSRLIPGKEYKCPFSFKSPQHPFITVLEKNVDATQDVLNQMQALCTHPDYTISSNSLELLRPVFLWLVCNPRGCHLPTWQLLLSLTDHAVQPETVLECLCWQQSKDPKQVESVYSVYAAAVEAALHQQQRELLVSLVPLVARLSHYTAVSGRDPRPCYALLSRCFSQPAPELRQTAGLTLALLADNLTVSCASHLNELVNLGLTIINNYELPRLPLSIFVSQSLQWLHLPSSLTHAASKTITKIIDLHKNDSKNDDRLIMANLQRNKVFQTLIHSDYRLSIYYKLFTCWEKFKDNPDKLSSWFTDLESVDDVFQLDLVGFLFGVLLEKDCNDAYEDIVLQSLSILVKLIDAKKYLAVSLLPVLMYKIANEKIPEIRLECLKAVPLMAKSKENVPTIVSYLNKLRSNKGAPTSLLIHLYLTLTEVQVRCFPYLQELLVDMTTKPDESKWENDIARAVACERICQIRPSSGVELVPVLSSILNRCGDEEGGAASACALQCIGALWSHGAVDPVSTWTALSQRLVKDNRTDVIVSVCQLLGKVPKLSNQRPEYDALLESTASHLWHLLGENCPRVSEAACTALANYQLTQYSLKAVPEIYRKTVQLPASYCKTPEDAARKPEDVLDYIPCEIWPQVYKYASPVALPYIEYLTAELIEVELRSYRSGVYNTDGRGEPSDMSYLSASSVVRGLLDFLRKQATRPTYDFPEASLISILNCVSREFSRPLPPLELMFVHELCGRGAAWRARGVALAARHVSATATATATSAGRLLATWLVGFDGADLEESDVITLFEILPSLCRNLPPNALRSPLEKSLAFAFDKVHATKIKKTKDERRYRTESGRIRTESGRIRTESGRNRTESGRIRTVSGRNRTESGRIRTESGRIRTESGRIRTESGRVRTESGRVRTESGKSKTEYEEEPLFITLLYLMKDCFECEKIHDANRSLLTDIFVNYFDLISEDNISWPAYLSVCPSLTPEGGRALCPGGRWGAEGEELRKSAAVCAACALHWGPAVLQEIVDAAVGCPGEHESTLRVLGQALKVAGVRQGGEGERWLRQLMARAQNTFTQTSEESAKAYLCEVFSTCVQSMSGAWTLRDTKATAAAVAALLARDHWASSTAQVCGWLSHAAVRRVMPAVCRQTLVVARHLPDYPAAIMWTVLNGF